MSDTLNRLQPSRLLLLLLMLLTPLTSCVTFESGETPGHDQWPPAAGSAQWLHVTLEGLPRKFVSSWERGVKRELEQSERFQGVELMTRVSSPYAMPDVRVHLQFDHSRQNLWTSRIWMGLCAMTATVIPARTVQYFDVHATVQDGDGNPLGTIERSVSASTWVGILTLFVLPFEGAGHSEMVRDTTRSIVNEAIEKGWL